MSLARQLEEAVQDAQYVVRWVTNVDHPEKRNDSFRLRTRDPSGTTVKAHKASYPKKERAMAHFQSLLDGDEDFGSEFTSSIEVYQVLANGRTRQVVKTVERVRGEDGKIRSV